jgi:hypothetical protein
MTIAAQARVTQSKPRTVPHIIAVQATTMKMVFKRFAAACHQKVFIRCAVVDPFVS